MPNNCGSSQTAIVSIVQPKSPLNAIVLYEREFDYNDNISVNSSTTKMEEISRRTSFVLVKNSKIGWPSDVSRWYFLAYVRASSHLD